MHKLSFIVVALLALVSCTSSQDYTTGNWKRLSDFNGKARTDAAGFTIGTKGYLSGGYYGKEALLKDLWCFDMSDGAYGSWTQLADMPDGAIARQGATGFTVGTKGYIATGWDRAANDYLTDCWQYDPATDSWTRMDDFAGGKRRYALSFTIGDYGYAGFGYDDNYLKDIYRLDPTAASGSQWTIVSAFGGQKRMGGMAFVINDVAYICGGTNNNSDAYDFWKFDPSASDPWTRLRDITNTNSDKSYDDKYTTITRTFGCAFVIDGLGYVATGQSASTTMRSDYWKYDPAKDLWYYKWDGDRLTTFGEGQKDTGGSTRVHAVCFSTGSRGIITTGGSGSSSYFDDTWELLPNEKVKK